MEIPQVNTRPDYFSIFGVLSTIALICLCITCMARTAKLHSIALAPSVLPGNAIATTPLIIHDESGVERTASSSSPILRTSEIDNFRKWESTPSLSRTLSQSPNPEKISDAVEMASPPSLSKSKINRRSRQPSAKARVAISRSFAANLRRIIVSFQLRSSTIGHRSF
jgi:hypothetical protein